MATKVEMVDVQKVVEVSYKGIECGRLYLWNGDKVTKTPRSQDDVYTRFGKSIVSFRGNTFIDVNNILEISSAEDRFILAPKGTKVTIEN